MKEKINSIQFTSTFILCIISSSIGLSLYTTIKIASIDSYISVVIGSILGLIPLILFLYIFNYQIDAPIYKKNTLIFGKIFGNIINIIITILYLIIGITILFNLGNFIVSQYLSETPLLLILIVLGLTIFYIINKGIETITRVSSIFIVIVIFSFIFSFIYLFQEIKLDNLKPILEFGLKKPLLGGFVNMLITTSPIFTLLIFPKENITDEEKITKYIIIGYIISAIIIFLISFLSNAILGKYLIKLYQYPGYISLKKISLFNFIDRIENFLSIHWILSCFICLSIILYYIKTNIKRKGNSKLLNIFLCIIVIILSYNIFKNNTQFNNYIYMYYPYILLTLLIIYIIIALSIIIKKKITKKK